MVVESEEFIRSFAEKRNINVIGSINPQAIGATDGDFYDALHPKREFFVELLSVN